MESVKPVLFVIAGPTASGKSNLALKLATLCQSEILSADSRQCFRELTIGTAKPSPEELQMIRHHFINSHSLEETFSAGQFAEQALAVSEKLIRNEKIPIVVGGTGLYLKALIQGLDEIPPVAASVREEVKTLYLNEGIEAIRKIVQQSDPEFYSKTDKNNPQRLIRAVEIILGTGQAFSSYLNKSKPGEKFNVISVVIDWPREQLYERINTRVDHMIQEGLFEEAESLYQYKEKNALKTVGYSEIFDFIEGKYSREKAIEKIKQHSRNYAKRQMTWFRNQGSYTFLPPDAVLSCFLAHQPFK